MKKYRIFGIFGSLLILCFLISFILSWGINMSFLKSNFYEHVYVLFYTLALIFYVLFMLGFVAFAKFTHHKLLFYTTNILIVYTIYEGIVFFSSFFPILTNLSLSANTLSLVSLILILSFSFSLLQLRSEFGNILLFVSILALLSEILFFTQYVSAGILVLLVVYILETVFFFNI